MTFTMAFTFVCSIARSVHSAGELKVPWWASHQHTVPSFSYAEAHHDISKRMMFPCGAKKQLFVQ